MLHGWQSLTTNGFVQVGDRLTTDIEFGRRGGLQTLLVLTGVTHEHELASLNDPMQVPDVYVDSVNDLNTLHAARVQTN
jgi:ribonucleotide monophosphatase NagD (HAD superfamily)